MLTLKAVTYKCSCGHTQTITYFYEDMILPVTCCVHCKAGFGKELSDMMARRLGMFPESAPVIVQHEPEFSEATQ